MNFFVFAILVVSCVTQSVAGVAVGTENGNVVNAVNEQVNTQPGAIERYAI